MAFWLSLAQIKDQSSQQALEAEQLLGLQAEINESPRWPVFGQEKISRHGSQEASYSVQLALMEWEWKARKAQVSC